MIVKVWDKRKMNWHKEYQKEKIKEFQPIIDEIQTKLKNGKHVTIIRSNHSHYRVWMRKISLQKVMNVIMEGTMIEYQGTENKRNEIKLCKKLNLNGECANIIMAKKIGKKIIHVCINIQDGTIIIKTVYYPNKSKWTNDGTQRIFYKNVFVQNKKEIKNVNKKIKNKLKKGNKKNQVS